MSSLTSLHGNPPYLIVYMTHLVLREVNCLGEEVLIALTVVAPQSVGEAKLDACDCVLAEHEGGHGERELRGHQQQQEQEVLEQLT